MSAQRQAADPRRSAFVAANAGSGKTKTLVERVARLLLSRARPDAILCVTYTKAAAAEMQRRLFETLGRWAVMEDADLRAALVDLGETEGDLREARRLFARALETPGGLKIQTLHAFCEKLLRRFPLEAGVSPGFRVLDDVAAGAVVRRAREALGREVLSQPDSPLAEAYGRFVLEYDYQAFEALLASFEAEREPLADYLERSGGLAGAERSLAETMGFDSPLPDPADLEAAVCASCEPSSMREVAAALEAGGMKSDLALAATLRGLADTGGRPLSELLGVFLTEKREPRKLLTTGQVADAARLRLQRMMESCLAAEARLRAGRTAAATLAALRLAEACARAYEREKLRLGGLDFPDLVAKARRLLTEAGDAAWILFKLDGGIDHILLDEAQDTSPEQWAILDALTSEFFAGEGRRTSLRTLFAVGDEKQSIFSFQGADPEELNRQTLAYAERAQGARAPLDRVELLESWRSAPEVLEFVDTVFALTPLGSAEVRHSAVRAAGHGTVDLWALFEDRDEEEIEAWDAPLDAPPKDSARRRLARAIAQEIGRLTREDAVAEKGAAVPPRLRAARPGDVLILVRTRNALYEEILRALKAEGVPAAGADRLLLSDHVVFHDVLSLIRFCLYPDDDLTLAEILRSPFCEVSEEELFDLAFGRAGSLWSTLKSRAGERESYVSAVGLLEWARREAERGPPFEFLARLLSRLDAKGRSMRQRIATRLGPAALDVVEEILGRALTAEDRGVLGLEGFAAELELSAIEVKRELDPDASDVVRIMTVHGAKGLEAPVVILADAASAPANRGGARLLRTEDGGVLLGRRKDEDCGWTATARRASEAKAAEEQKRLLYVALTRARDRLIIAGRKPGRNALKEGCWYDLVSRAFDALATRPIGSGPFEVRRFGADPTRRAPPSQPGFDPAPELPPWARGGAPPEGAQDRLRPSGRIAGGQTPSPLARRGGLGRFRRGLLIHRLLEVLPELDRGERRAAAQRLLAKEGDLSPDQIQEMTEAALGVLLDPAFAEVFGPGSRAEAAIAGLAPELAHLGPISGRVDRLLVTPSRVLVADFKSNRPSPDRAGDVDPAYLAQMAIYVAVLRSIFPDRRVEAALVWTDGPKLTVLPPVLIEETLELLARGD